MQVKFLTNHAERDQSGQVVEHFTAGWIYELPRHQALDYIDRRIAKRPGDADPEPLVSAEPSNLASKPADEPASKRRRKSA